MHQHHVLSAYLFLFFRTALFAPHSYASVASQRVVMYEKSIRTALSRLTHMPLLLRNWSLCAKNLFVQRSRASLICLCCSATGRYVRPNLCFAKI
jgi:hypothetical protein